MPFVAYSKVEDRNVCALDYENLRTAFPRASDTDWPLECQFCGAPMLPVQGMMRIQHFRHQADCTADVEKKGESLEHLIGKLYLRDQLLHRYPGTRVELEVPLLDRRRVADVLVRYPDGWAVAHEVQLSNCDPREMSARMDDYALAGVDLVWWLSKKASKPMLDFVNLHQAVYVLDFDTGRADE